MTETQVAWDAAIQSWYGEEPDWNYATHSSDGGVTGHFTQMVWKGTTKIGCAMNVNCNNMWAQQGFKNNVVVCRYMQAGNYQGQYAANVMGLETTSCAADSSCPR